MTKRNFEESLRRRTRGLVWIRAFKTGVATLAVCAAVGYAGLGIAYYHPEKLNLTISPLIFWFVLLGLPLFATFIRSRFERHDVRRLSLSLEQQYPQLQERLLTVVELAGKGASSQHPFSRMLADKLEQEMGSLVDRFSFGRTIAFRDFIVPLAILGIFLIGGSVQALVAPAFFSQGFRNLTTDWRMDFGTPAMPQVALPTFAIEVTPGNCEIAKGSNLLIQARTVGHGGEKAELVVKWNGNPSWRILTMNKVESQLFEHVLSNVTEPAVYYVRVDSRSSPTYKIKIVDVFSIERAIWTLSFPAYMHLADQKRQGWHEKMAVPEGTSVHLELTMSRPAASGVLNIGEGKSLPLKNTVEKNTLEAKFMVNQDMTLRAEVQSAGGQPLSEVKPLWIQMLPDLPPYLEVLLPQTHNYVYATEEIPFQINVSDDFGVQAVELVLQYHGMEKRIDWLKNQKGKDSLSLRPVLALERFGLESRDLVLAHLEVTDNYPGKTHVIRSSGFSFLIRDYYEQFRFSSRPEETPSLRTLFEKVVMEQDKLMKDLWDHLSRPPDEKPVGWEVSAEEAKQKS